MMRKLRSITHNPRARKIACAFFLAEIILLPLVAFVPMTVLADDCNQDWTRAED